MSSETDRNLPLPLLYRSTLVGLLPVLDDSLSTSSPKAQALLSAHLPNLHLIGRMISSLGVFSANETMEEVGDGEMVFMSLGWVVGEAESRGGLGGLPERKSALLRAKAAYEGFQELLQSYAVVERAILDGEAPADQGARREAKIKAYKREKELRQSIEPPPSDSPAGYIVGLIEDPSSSSSGSTSVNPGALELRQPTLALLRYLYHLSVSSTASLAAELAILAEAPEQDLARQAPESTAPKDDTWRLDVVPRNVAPRQLISGGGRVLQPFTILPSMGGLSERERLRGEVFRQSHRLPTMTIDEYLEEEQRRGNIITGGGQASYDAPTESELLELAAENDGSMAAEEAEEKKRIKEEKWAQYTDAHRKGEGNTMNRG